MGVPSLEGHQTVTANSSDNPGFPVGPATTKWLLNKNHYLAPLRAMQVVWFKQD
jgi:hypothetical protein